MDLEETREGFLGAEKVLLFVLQAAQMCPLGENSLSSTLKGGRLFCM